MNPDHLEEAPAVANTMRGRSFSVANKAKTHCPHDHPYSPANTFINSNGSRVCVACWIDRYGYPPLKGLSA